MISTGTPQLMNGLGFTETHDIMCESKAKNLASFALAEQAKKLGCF